MDKPMEIPSNCYECQIAQTCTVLSRWGTKDMFKEYRYRRHADCPYNALAKLAEHIYRKSKGEE